MTLLRYEIFNTHLDGPQQQTPGRLGKLVMSGSITPSATASATITVPNTGGQPHLMLVLRHLNAGAGVYTYVGMTFPSDNPQVDPNTVTAAHAAQDPLNKILLGPSGGGQDVSTTFVAPSVKFSVIAAAAVP